MSVVEMYRLSESVFINFLNMPDIYLDECAMAEIGAYRDRVCPIGLLPGRICEHWSFETMCRWFECGVCMADPMDLGFLPDGECGFEKKEENGGEDLEIPF